MNDSPSSIPAATPNPAEQLVREHLNLTARGDLAAAGSNVTSDFFNHRSADEPIEARLHGPQGLRATIRWLHRAFTDMRFEFHEVLVVGDRAVARVTLHARQHGPFVVHGSPDGRVTDAFPSNGRAFAAPQTHCFRIARVRLRNTTRFAMILGWPSNWDGFHRRQSTLFGCYGRGGASGVATRPNQSLEPTAGRRDDYTCSARIF
jgi:ketosteroid isomerase-like protein